MCKIILVLKIDSSSEISEFDQVGIISFLHSKTTFFELQNL